MDNNFESIIGFPNEKYEITYAPEKIYGFAYINRLTSGWICNAGTLPYLFGCYQTFITLNNVLSNETYNNTGSIFFELNENFEPIKVITSINTTKGFVLETTGMKEHIVTKIMNISYLDGDDFPKLEFITYLF